MTPLAIAKTLSQKIGKLKFSDPVAHVYNPLDYAWGAHADYLQKYGGTPREILLLGMNPGPWGMAQTGVPFGEVRHVRDWLGIEGEIGRPQNETPKKPVSGFACQRSEVSGKRFWGFAQKQFQTPQKFFKRFLVLNYCPLLFLDAGGRNLTPDKIAASERAPLQKICDDALQNFVEFYQPKFAIGVGGFAKACLERIVTNPKISLGTILHPSPANPQANRGWEAIIQKQFQDLGVVW